MKSRLLRLMRSFSREELKSFSKFVRSPFLITIRNTSELFDYLVQFYPDFDSPELNKKAIEKELFGSDKNADKKLENLLVDLTKSAEHFLAHLTFYEDDEEVLLNLSKGYLNKNLPGESNRINKDIEKKLQPTFSPNADYTSKLKRLTNLKLEHYKENNHLENVSKSIEDIFEASVLQFIFEYIQYENNIYVARHNSGKKLENRFIQESLQIINFKELLKWFEKKDYMKTPKIALYYYVFKTIEEADDINYYYLLKKLFIKNLADLNREEKYFFYMHLGNYCINKWEHNVKDFDKETLNIFKGMLKNDSYSAAVGQNIDLMTYRTMVLSSYSLRDIKLLNQLVKKYVDCLSDEHRDNIRQYSNAYLYFLKNEFDRSLEYISTFKNNKFHIFKLDVKQLSLKNYYELNSFDQAVTAIDAYKHFIDSNKQIPEFSKIFYRNFIKTYKDLLKIKYGKSKEDPSFIKREIENNKKIVSKIWLLEKVEELL